MITNGSHKLKLGTISAARGVMDVIERFKDVYNRIDKEPAELINELYTEDVTFIDPFHTIEGLEGLLQYIRDSYHGVISCQFSFGEPLLGDERAFIPWTMHLKHRKLNAGQQIDVPGGTDLRFKENMAHYHHDYFDAGKMLYENVPAIGWAIRKIKARL